MCAPECISCSIHPNFKAQILQEMSEVFNFHKELIGARKRKSIYDSRGNQHTIRVDSDKKIVPYTILKS